MRIKKIVENYTRKSAAAAFLAFKRAQKLREKTLRLRSALSFQKTVLR